MKLTSTWMGLGTVKRNHPELPAELEKPIAVAEDFDSLRRHLSSLGWKPQRINAIPDPYEYRTYGKVDGVRVVIL